MLALLLVGVILSALSLVVPWWEVAGHSGGSPVPVTAKAGPFDGGRGLVSGLDALVVGFLAAAATVGLLAVLVRELRALDDAARGTPEHSWWILGIAAALGAAILWAVSAWYRDVGSAGAEAGGYVGWWLAVGAFAATLAAGYLTLQRRTGPESLNQRAA